MEVDPVFIEPTHKTDPEKSGVESRGIRGRLLSRVGKLDLTEVGVIFREFSLFISHTNI